MSARDFQSLSEGAPKVPQKGTSSLGFWGHPGRRSLRSLVLVLVGLTVNEKLHDPI